jgi:hypothetical protein
VCESGSKSDRDCDMSDNYFKIVSAPITTGNIKVLSPNGGETLTTGEYYTIRWEGPDLSQVPGYQNLAWSIGWFRPNGNAGSIITIPVKPFSIPIIQFSYNWKVELPSWITLPVSDVKIRVSLVKNCLNPNLPCPEPASLISVPFDESDNYFTITGPSVTGKIQVLSPNGGEAWQRDSIQQIKWQDTLDPISTTQHYKIELLLVKLLCEGLSKCPQQEASVYVIADDVVRMSGPEVVFEWRVGMPVSMYGRLYQIPDGVYKIGVCRRSFTLICDYSDNTFEIRSPVTIKLISPNGGETLVKGTPYLIKWTGGYPIVTDPERSIALSLEKEDGTMVGWIQFGNPPEGTFYWDPAKVRSAIGFPYNIDVPDGRYKIRVSDYNHPKGAWEAFDLSDAPFTITSP